MGRKVLGLEIAPQMLKIALVKNGKHPELLYCNTTEIATVFNGNGVLSDEETDVASLALAIKETILRNPILSKGVEGLSICVNNPQTVVRPISLPALPDKELSAAVEYDISQSFPGVVKTHIISYKEYAHTKTARTGIVSFSPRRVIDPLRSLATILDYKESSVDVTANAEAKALKAFVQNGTADRVFFLCDIGPTNTQFTVIEKGRVRHSRQIPEGGHALKEMFCDKMGISSAEFDKVCLEGINELDLPTSHFNSIFRVVYSNLTEQILQTIEFQNTTIPDSPIAEVLLTGDGSVFPQLDEYFTEALGLPTSVVKPLASVKVDRLAFSKTLPAIGAAIRED